MVILATMSETRSLVDVKAHLSELVARVGSQHERVTVTVHGRPAAVLVAVDDLEALEETIAPTVRRLLSEQLPTAVAFAPHRVGQPLRGPLEGCHSARRGTYRVIYRIDDVERRVTVVGVLPRSDVYRPH